MISKVLHCAFEYRDRGWPVIPVQGKTPAVPWATYQNRTPSVEEIKVWFTSKVDYNLAVVIPVSFCASEHCAS